MNSSSGQFQLTKTVQGDRDTTPQSFPAVGHVKLTDGEADYAINWQNTGAPDLNSVVLYDVFPHVGDTGVSGAQASEARGSQFQPLLASVGSAPANVTISYSASTNPCRVEVYPGQDSASCLNDWTQDPADLGGLANVLSLRLVSNATYQTGEGFSLGYRMSVPTIDKDLIAWNSVAAYSQTVAGVALLPTESPKVGITASDDRFTIGKTVDADKAVPGDTLTYQVTVGNTGTAVSVPTIVKDELPAGVSFVSADNGGRYTAETRTISWNIPAISRDATLVLTVAVTVDSLQSKGAIVNRATIINPAGYSLPILNGACTDGSGAVCARTAVPVSLSVLGYTGSELPWLAGAGGLLALTAGMTLLVLRRRSRQE